MFNCKNRANIKGFIGVNDGICNHFIKKKFLVFLFKNVLYQILFIFAPSNVSDQLIYFVLEISFF